MQFKKNNLDYHFSVIYILLFTLIIHIPAFAISNDKKHLINIESDIQLLDIKHNTITCIGNVIVTNGTLKISANKIIINRINDKYKREIIDGYGNPVTFYQMQNNNKLATGHASQIHYEIIKNCIILIDNAYLDQLNNNITGAKIIYLINEHRMQAFSKKNKRVTAKLTPYNMKNKNSIYNYSMDYN